VYRDAEFTSDMHDRTVKRIKDVMVLKNYQFPEDSGPNAHPVQPQEYMEINNFYTVTVYEKGAEVVGMLHTLVGAELFRQGSDLYFDRFDGMAVTTEDFVACMEEVSGQDFTQFKRWYIQAGTPHVDVSESYDASNGEYKLRFIQQCKPTPGQTEKLPFVIPVRMGLLDSVGQDLPIQCDGQFNAGTQVLTLTEADQTVTFTGLLEKPVASLFRDFSAPVRISFQKSEADQLLIATKDSNAFNRFDAVQQIYQNTLTGLMDGELTAIPELVRTVVTSILDDQSVSNAMKATMLRLPGYQLLVDNRNHIDARVMIDAREALNRFIAEEFKDRWQFLTQDLASADEYEFNAQEAGRRELQALALVYWVNSGDAQAVSYAEALYRAAHNQTDRLNGLRAVLESQDTVRKQSLLEHFYRHWKDDTQMVETWFSLQSSAKGVNVEQLQLLMEHDAFDLTNPNKVRSVLSGFAMNFEAFHDEQGQGYQLLADMIIRLNAINPSIAARFVPVLDKWRKFTPQRSDQMKDALTRVMSADDLSPDVLELTQKALA
jgi:aminopeptidase N